MANIYQLWDKAVLELNNANPEQLEQNVMN